MFEQLDALLLARIQFAFTVSFHFIFPAFSIGLASYLAVLEGLWLKTGKSIYLDLFKYWLKIFAIAFAMGVVSGIVFSGDGIAVAQSANLCAEAVLGHAKFRFCR